MGDHVAAAAVTGVEFRQFGHSVNRKFDELVTLITSVPQPAVHNLLPFKLPYKGTGVRQATQEPGFACASIPASNEMVTSTSIALSGPISDQIYDKTQRIPTYQPAEAGPQVSSIPRLPNISIPNLGRERGAWRRAIAQWEEVDVATGLALKDWPSEWYRDDQRLKMGSIRSQRQTIFEEFER